MTREFAMLLSGLLVNIWIEVWIYKEDLFQIYDGIESRVDKMWMFVLHGIKQDVLPGQSLYKGASSQGHMEALIQQNHVI